MEADMINFFNGRKVTNEQIHEFLSQVSKIDPIILDFRNIHGFDEKTLGRLFVAWNSIRNKQKVQKTSTFDFFTKMSAIAALKAPEITEEQIKIYLNGNRKELDGRTLNVLSTIEIDILIQATHNPNKCQCCSK